MRKVLLFAAAAIMILVPAGAAVMLAAFPGVIARIPVAFWLLWALGSMVLSLEASTLSDWLTPRSGGIHKGNRILRWVVALGLINLASGVTVLIFLARSNAE